MPSYEITFKTRVTRADNESQAHWAAAMLALAIPNWVYGSPDQNHIIDVHDVTVESVSIIRNDR